MQVSIRTRGLRLTENLREHIERRLQFATDRFDQRLGDVAVQLTDVNGPRGGVDKMCHISADLVPSGKIVVEEKGDMLIATVNRAVKRLGRTLARTISKEEEDRRLLPMVRTAAAGVE